MHGSDAFDAAASFRPEANDRPTRTRVDLDALSHNFHALQAHAGVPVMGIVKANAYGHGLVPVARHLQAQGIGQLGVGGAGRVNDQGAGVAHVGDVLRQSHVPDERLARRAPAAPPEIPGFVYQRLLGSGGFSDVYLYEQQLPRRLRAPLQALRLWK